MESIYTLGFILTWFYFIYEQKGERFLAIALGMIVAVFWPFYLIFLIYAKFKSRP